MTTTIIITICILLLLAYVFDISSALTKIPSVILLLLLGWTVKQIVDLFHIQIPDLNPLLPILGTIGLILIVLEGSLELELNKSKLSLIKKSSLNALILFGQVSFKMALVNAIPFCVISSAIAIPSVRNLSAFNKEFIIYESSLSDIFGVLFFNFIALNHIINTQSFGNFAVQFLLIIAISFCAVLGLSFLLSRIKHHITYTPIILMVILIYAISKVYHLPGLIFILVFGLFLGNLDELKQFKWIEKLRPEKLDKEVKKFKEITTEATFLIRALFFLLFGFLMEAKEILNPETIPWAAAIILLIVLVRWLALMSSKIPSSPLLYVAPRGLITILLFLAIQPDQSISIVNKSLIIQTIILSVLVMMFGLMTTKKNEIN
ncbi:MAG: cation:proton antiporter [Saprospiraceae bacterium]|nr:cation:proton antiporter [Candidatus Vicinibacter affinis]